MIVYSKVLNRNSELFLIKFLRKNKWFWIHKFFFDDLSKKQTLILIKDLLFRSYKVVFVQLEGLSHHWYYRRPTILADFNFGYREVKKTIYWNIFFDVASKNIDFDPRFTKKSTSNLIPEICFVSSNPQKIADVKKYSDLYREMHIYGNFHQPIENDEKIEKVSGKELDRSYNSLFTTSRYMASLCIENTLEEGYAQCSALWSLKALTPPILKTQPCRKNFIRSEFYIDFDDYIKMSKQQRLVVIGNVQERLLSGESYLTNLTKDYLEFFRESFSGNNEPDIKKITLESQAFRTKFITI
jgi:hypothetical protein